MSQQIPRVFVSYSWDDDDHQQWVRGLSTRLRSDGVDVTLDQWHAVPGDQLPAFMESAIRDNDFVLVVCTPKYRDKSDNRLGGVGYEGDIISGELIADQNHRKFIPVLRGLDWRKSSPSWVRGKYYICLNTVPYSENEYSKLLATLHGKLADAPPIGGNAIGRLVDSRSALHVIQEHTAFLWPELSELRSHRRDCSAEVRVSTLKRISDALEFLEQQGHISYMAKPDGVSKDGESVMRIEIYNASDQLLNFIRQTLPNYDA